jgi:DNA-binding transcriptional MerR regulator
MYSYSMPQKSKKMPQLLTLQQTCELLQCHPNSLRQWDAKGILVAVRIGVRRDRRYRRDDILRFIEQRK